MAIDKSTQHQRTVGKLERLCSASRPGTDADLSLSTKSRT
jgi:hypothetical protein